MAKQTPTNQRSQLSNLGLVWRHAARYPRPHRGGAVLPAACRGRDPRVPYAFKLIIDRGFGSEAASTAAVGQVPVSADARDRDGAATAVRFYFVSWIGERDRRRHPPRGAPQPAAPRRRASSRRTARPRSPAGSPSTPRSSNRSSARPSRSRCATSPPGSARSSSVRAGAQAGRDAAPRHSARVLPMIIFGRRVRTAQPSVQDRIADVGSTVSESSAR